MEETTPKEIVCRKIRKTTGVRIVCEPYRLFSYPPYPYGSEKYWDWCERQAEQWIDEFRAFLRDHRSQDANSMSCERDVEDACSFCEHKWNPVWHEDEKASRCGHCGEKVENPVDGKSSVG